MTIENQKIVKVLMNCGHHADVRFKCDDGYVKCGSIDIEMIDGNEVVTFILE